MIQTATLGYPRIGQNRELKKATEAYWKGEITQQELKKAGQKIRKENWALQKDAGINVIPSNDFSFYDGMLDMTALLGAVPRRFSWDGNKVDLDTYFSMARGNKSAHPMEMTKWFDTNYHYIVSEFHKNSTFKLASDKPFLEYKEARDIGLVTRPVIVGPITYLLLGKIKDEHLSRYELLKSLLTAYVSILNNFKMLGCNWIQIDEPVLCMDLDIETQQAFRDAYSTFRSKVPEIKLMLTTYFGALKENLLLASSLPVSGIHVDLVRAPEELNNLLRSFSNDITISLGVIDGRNIWRANLEKIIQFLKPALETRSKDNIIISTSCSLLHTPLDLEVEDTLDGDLKRSLSFAKQKLKELTVIRKALQEGEKLVLDEINLNKAIIEDRKKSTKIHIKNIQERVHNISLKDYSRKSPYKVRRQIQRNKLKLPIFPTTTIGSFPQTSDIRAARAKLKSKEISIGAYNEFVKSKIKDAVKKQTDIGLDILVHGEPERNDMVEYFGEMLDGFAFTKNGWVQSYGTRCVKPPIIYGDVKRTIPMTVEWIKYAQSLTDKPVKGILTGPVTILQWSFVRDDQERSKTAKQIALAIRDEVHDLEANGISIIQIDEPAIREGLPLHKSDWSYYLKWAVECFKLASCGINDETQLHTHMCYSEFNDIIDPIARMDADVISIESSRSQMELLEVFANYKYPNEIGPGVFDVHSPRIPTSEEIKDLLKKASKVIPADQIWVNPDCGLKTRGWEETTSALIAMVQAAKLVRVETSHATSLQGFPT